MAFTPAVKKFSVERNEFFVPDDSTVKDLMDAVHFVQRALEATGSKTAHYDDAFRVKAGDEGIILYFDVERVI